ncbi:hypothetical protein KG089_05235 [Carnobacteriaceae bacterium zg-ZUI252]|nr:hypothetical protein [Carnobacteriaceae bacterium zg-ZUI252]
MTTINEHTDYLISEVLEDLTTFEKNQRVWVFYTHIKDVDINIISDYSYATPPEYDAVIFEEDYEEYVKLVDEWEKEMKRLSHETYTEMSIEELYQALLKQKKDMNETYIEE